MSVPKPLSVSSFVEFHGNDLQLQAQLPNNTLPHIEGSVLKKPKICDSISDPRMPCKFFKTQLCTRFNLGNCHYGDKCPFAHGVRDIRNLQPLRQGVVSRDGNFTGSFGGDYRMCNELKLCTMFFSGKECKFGEGCRFLHEVPNKLRQDNTQFRKSKEASGVVTTGPNGGRRSAQLECTTFVNAGSNAIQGNPKLVIYKMRLCNKWKATGFCSFGNICNFAHGQAELQKFDSNNMPESRNLHHFSAKDEIPSDSVIAPCNQQLQGLKCKFKWTGDEKINGIYADWIDDAPFIHVG